MNPVQYGLVHDKGDSDGDTQRGESQMGFANRYTVHEVRDGNKLDAQTYRSMPTATWLAVAHRVKSYTGLAVVVRSLTLE